MQGRRERTLKRRKPHACVSREQKAHAVLPQHGQGRLEVAEWPLCCNAKAKEAKINHKGGVPAENMYAKEARAAIRTVSGGEAWVDGR